jgi:hypothetical protein
LEMLLLFLEDLENPDPPQTKFVVAAEQWRILNSILACAIDLEIFKQEYQKKITLPTKPPGGAERDFLLKLR